MDRLKKILHEELTKTEVRGMIDSKLDSFRSDRDFKKSVREIVADVFEDFFKDLYRKNGFWKNGIKNVV